MTIISRPVLEATYKNSLEPFLLGLREMTDEFKELFSVVQLPDIGMDLLDQLDSTIYFACCEFRIKKELTYELVVDLHFNKFDYVLELNLTQCNYSKTIQRNYDEAFRKEDQVDCIHEIGRLIVATIQASFSKDI